MPPQQYPTITAAGVIGSFYEGLETYEQNSIIPELCFMQPSNQEIETYGFLDEVPPMEEMTGTPPMPSLNEKKITVINKEFITGMKVFKKDFRRDKTGQIVARTRDLAARASDLKLDLLCDLILAGTGSTKGYAYDDHVFFDTNHEEDLSGSQKNLIAAGDYAELNVATPTNPTADEASKVLMKMVQHFYSLKDSKGKQKNRHNRRFLPLVPVNLWGAFSEAVRSKSLNTGAGSRDNVLPGIVQILDPVATPCLTDDDVVYLFIVDGGTRPFIFQEEVAPEMEMLGEGSDFAVREKAYYYTVYASCNAAYGQWQHALMAQLS